jgi:acetyl esterase/lipase
MILYKNCNDWPQVEPAVAAFLNRMPASDDAARTISRARARIEELEGPAAEMPPVTIEDREIRGSIAGPVVLRIIRPRNVEGWLPGILYLHGGGWVAGGYRTHEWIVRSLASECRAVVAFLEYHLSPEVHFPIALEESYAALDWLGAHGPSVGIDPTQLAIVGDSAGGNMAAVVSLFARQRCAVQPVAQVLFYPTTHALHEFPSFRTFGAGYYLGAEDLAWSRAQYLPDPASWTHPSVSPLAASTNELSILPPTTIITAEFDPLRDEGEAFAARLSAVGVPVQAVRFLGTIHAFLSLRALALTRAPEVALQLAAVTLRTAFRHKVNQPR